MMKIRLLTVSIVAILSAGSLNSCKKEATDNYPCDGISAVYSNDIDNILNTHCAISGCHGAGSKKGWVNLSGYENSRNEASKKQFLGAIQHKKGYSAMPKNGNMLSDSLIRRISCWVQNGMPEN